MCTLAIAHYINMISIVFVKETNNSPSAAIMNVATVFKQNKVRVIHTCTYLCGFLFINCTF